MPRYGLKIVTTRIGGRYQHTKYDIGAGHDTTWEVPNNIVREMEHVNELLWEQMSEGAGPIASTLEYRAPRK